MAILDSYYSLFLIWFICSMLAYILTEKLLNRKKMHHPPCPPALPVIGHIHLLSKILPSSLQTLASRYGPLMRIYIGSSTSLIVSNAIVAGEVMKTHDLNFAYKPEFGASDYLLYKGSSFFGADYGTYWRFLKKICMTELLSTPQLSQSINIRKEEVVNLLEVVLKCSDQREACNLGSEVMKMTNNIICRSTMSTRCSGSANESQMIREFVKGIGEVSAKLSFGEVFGPLKRFDLFGYGRRLHSLLMKYDKLVEAILKDHEKERGDGEGDRKDMMDILLQISKDETAEVKLTRNDIKSFLLEMFLAGTDTTSVALQWILAEIINHPDVYKKLRHEIMAVVGPNRLVEESDISTLPYLQAVVKESLRLHPPLPLILRKCKEDCTINGYDILANSRLLINAHAIMRDPTSWKNPTEFVPDRFLASSTENSNQHEQANAKDQNLHYLPFGSGRRACPGAALASTVMHITVAMLVQCFNLETKDGKKVDMELGSGFTAVMARPLVCYPVLQINPSLLANLVK